VIIVKGMDPEGDQSLLLSNFRIPRSIEMANSSTVPQGEVAANLTVSGC
jgi:hypothetical protein